MFKKIPIILTAEELIHRSINRTKKIQINDINVLYKKKKTIIAKKDSFTENIISNLEKYVKHFPSIDQLPLFYQDILDIKIDVNKLRKSLGAIDWARKTCQMIYSKQSKALRKSMKIEFLKQKQNEIYGRISSVVKQINKELILLSEAQNLMRNLPTITNIPTVVIAGYPNVGKSSILRCLSAAKPEIAQYPFTTKEIHVGHIEKTENYIIKRFQLIDTPGLLDRSLSKRNEIEMQAIAALTHLADLIVFVLDNTETCGYSIKDQMNLLSQLEKMFKGSSFIIIENKLDFKNTHSSRLKVSCKTGKGIDLLIDEIFSYYNSKMK